MKYLFLNDVSYLIHKKKWVLCLLFISPLVVLFLNMQANVSVIDTIMISMGTNLYFSSSGVNILEMIMYLFNLFCFLYLISSLYLKDWSSNLENIFLRINPGKYILGKNVMFTGIIVSIKLIQYIIVICFFSIFRSTFFNKDIFLLVCTDILYILMIQYCFLLIYVFYLLFKKNIIFFVTSLILVGILLPKNIFELRNYIWILMLLVVGLETANYILFLKYNKNLIEKV